MKSRRRTKTPRSLKRPSSRSNGGNEGGFGLCTADGRYEISTPMTTRVGSRTQSVAACLDLDDGHKYGCEALRPHSCHVMSLSSHTYMHASYHSSSRHYSYMYCTAHLVVVGTLISSCTSYMYVQCHILSYCRMR